MSICTCETCAPTMVPASSGWPVLMDCTRAMAFSMKRS
ncbi:Uncharacterised protein [Bordetella pertussis]|nr:Uncharacterised protein [Bordetella pertussis]CFW40576.1 Uncharacterised protein [Bordetella pertussis]